MGVFDTIKSWFVGADQAPEAAPGTSMVGRPIPMSLPEAEKIKQAWYRLDAIKRYILQEIQDNRSIPPQKLQEFMKEFHQRVAYLLSKGQITPDEIADFDLVIKMGGK
jgi:hypothetical protein